MTDKPVTELSEALELIASLEAQCEELRRSGAGPDVLGEIEALLGEIRDEVASVGRRD